MELSYSSGLDLGSCRWGFDELVEGVRRLGGRYGDSGAEVSVELVRILQRLMDGACSSTGLGSRTGKTHWPAELQCKNTNQRIRSSILPFIEITSSRGLVS